jgi:hypothetical protein
MNTTFAPTPELVIASPTTAPQPSDALHSALVAFTPLELDAVGGGVVNMFY